VISARYAWPAAALLLLALVPTVAQVYLPPEPPAPGSLDAALPDVLGRSAVVSRGRRSAEWVEQQFGARDFASRRYKAPGHRPVDLFAARTYDAKRLFHYPELALTYGHARTVARWAGTDLPVRVLEFETSDSLRLAAYVLRYGDRPVRRPYTFLLGILPELWAGDREPMTLLYAQTSGTPRQRAELEREVTDLVLSACAALDAVE